MPEQAELFVIYSWKEKGEFRMKNNNDTLRYGGQTP